MQNYDRKAKIDKLNKITSQSSQLRETFDLAICLSEPLCHEHQTRKQYQFCALWVLDAGPIGGKSQKRFWEP